MPAITERGSFQFPAALRRKGDKSQTGTFETRSDAEAWVKDIEVKMYCGHFLGGRLARTTTLDACIARYDSEAPPDKECAVGNFKNNVLRRHRIVDLDMAVSASTVPSPE